MVEKNIVSWLSLYRYQNALYSSLFEIFFLVLFRPLSSRLILLSIVIHIFVERFIYYLHFVMKKPTTTTTTKHRIIEQWSWIAINAYCNDELESHQIFVIALSWRKPNYHDFFFLFVSFVANRNRIYFNMHQKIMVLVTVTVEIFQLGSTYNWAGLKIWQRK